jgi:hypothetical protein
MYSNREFNNSKRPIPMNTSSKFNGVAGEINKVAPLTGEGDGQLIGGVDRFGGERRSGIKRRYFSYTVYIPQRRSGRERRINTDTSLPSCQK